MVLEVHNPCNTLNLVRDNIVLNLQELTPLHSCQSSTDFLISINNGFEVGVMEECVMIRKPIPSMIMVLEDCFEGGINVKIRKRGCCEE